MDDYSGKEIRLARENMRLMVRINKRRSGYPAGAFVYPPNFKLSTRH